MLLVDRRPGRGRRPARRPPSAARRRSAPRRSAGAATRRGARRRSAASAAARRGRRSAPRTATPSAASAPISGTSTIAPLPALERRLGGRQVDLGLARAGDPVQEAARGGPPRRSRRRSASSARPLVGGQPTAGPTGRRPRRTVGAGGARSARRRHQAPGLEPPQCRRGRLRGPLRARRPRAARPAAPAARSAARWRGPRRVAVAERGPAGRGGAAPRSRAWARSRARAGPTPGGSTSSSPRAGVEQYSRAIQRPSRTSSGVAPAASASIGSASRSGGSSLDSATSTTTPITRRRPNGTSRTSRRRPRPAARAGGSRTGPRSARAVGQRLDLRDRHRQLGARRTARRASARGAALCSAPWRRSWHRGSR